MTFLISVYPFITDRSMQCLSPLLLQGSGGAEVSLSQGKDEVTTWTSHQFIARPHRDQQPSPLICLVCQSQKICFEVIFKILIVLKKKNR